MIKKSENKKQNNEIGGSHTIKREKTITKNQRKNTNQRKRTPGKQAKNPSLKEEKNKIKIRHWKKKKKKKSVIGRRKKK